MPASTYEYARDADARRQNWERETEELMKNTQPPRDTEGYDVEDFYRRGGNGFPGGGGTGNGGYEPWQPYEQRRY
jgi:hypothetical protein